MKSSFFNSVNYDRVYSAEDWADYFKRFIGNGVYAQPDTGMQIVSDGGMDIKCLDGSCFINGYTGVATEIEDKLTLEIGGVLYDRIDAVVARLDLNKRDIHIEVIQGLPAETPEKPEHIRNEIIFDLVLAYVTVSVGTTEITDADIEDVRADEALCGFVKGVVEQIQTGELFKQYKKEWDLLMAGVALDEPSIIEAFKALNSVRSVNGILPVEGNVELPLFEVITGSYTGNGKHYYTNIEDEYSDKNETPLFPVSFSEQSKEDVTINIGAEPSAVLIYPIDTRAFYKPYLSASTQYTIMKNFEYGSQNASGNISTVKTNCYVIQKNGSRFSGASGEFVTAGNTYHVAGTDAAGEPYSNYNYQYSATAGTALKVVSDDTEPSETEIRIGDLKTEMLLDERLTARSPATGTTIYYIVRMKKKSIDDIYVGMTIYRTTIIQKYYYNYSEFTELDEKGFVAVDSDTNGSGKTYGFIAFIKR